MHRCTSRSGTIDPRLTATPNSRSPSIAPGVVLLSLIALSPIAALAGQQPTDASTRAVPSAAASQPPANAASTRPAASARATAAPPKSPPTVPVLAGGTGLNFEERSHDLLAHLSAVIRLYRVATAPIQKVGEPSDALYRDQAAAQAGQVAEYAFASARAEAQLLDASQKAHPSGTNTPASDQTQQGEAERLQTTRTNVANTLTSLKAQDAAIGAQLAHARPKAIPALTDQKANIQGALELANAMSDALSKITVMSDTQGGTGLTGDIDRLARSAPELAAVKGKPVISTLASLDSERSSGVSSQAVVLFQLLASQHEIDRLTAQTADLHKQAIAVRAPLVKILRTTMQDSNVLTQQLSDGFTAPSPTSAAQPPAPGAALLSGSAAPTPTRKTFETATATFKAISSAAVPLSQEIILFEQDRANLLAWRATVNAEYHEVLRALLLRVFAIALALGVIFTLGEVWRRATTRYVQDPRRRRQSLALRRIIIGFLSGLVLIFGFVTQFNSLTTFAGFITAGLAVGLQTILLSVAAYFFIVGRYGVRVGDRISVAGVSGDVIDVGLVRFYIMELAGTGNDLHPTGRVAVFSNSVLFQAGTPLYKQMPGTEYAWHELTARLSTTADYKVAAGSLLGAVQTIYSAYQPRIEAQHKQLEAWMDARLDQPTIESRLQLVEGALQLVIRFPVEIREASQVDQQVTQSVLDLMHSDEQVKAAVIETPLIKSAVKS